MVSRQKPPPEAGADALYRWYEQEHAEEFKARKEGRSNGYTHERDHRETPFPINKAAEWAGKERPPRVFLDQRRLIPVPYVTMLAGQGAIGKTLLLLQLAVACATGTQWLGGDVMAGPAMIYSAEEPLRELHIRVDEICEAEKLNLAQLDRLSIADLSKVPDASLTRYDPKTGLWLLTDRYWALDQAVAEERPVMIGIDNRSMIVTGNENDRVGANFTVRNLGMIADRYGCAVVLLSHPSMAGLAQGTGQSGSTGWQTASRSFLYMRRPKEEGQAEDGEHGEDDGGRELINNKTNYSKMDRVVRMKWEFYRFVCTDPPLDQPQSPLGTLDKAERVFMKLLRWHISHDINVGYNKGPNYAPTVFDRHADREGINSKWFKMAMDSLLTKEKIKIVPSGPPSHRRFHIVPTEDFNL